MPRIAILVSVQIKPGCHAAYAAHIRKHAADTLREEPGCRAFQVLQPLAQDGTPDESRIALYELYEDMAAFDAHRANPRLPIVRAGAAPLIEGQTLTVCAAD